MKETAALFLTICIAIGLYANTHTDKHPTRIHVTYRSQADLQRANQPQGTGLPLPDGLTAGTPATPAAQPKNTDRSTVKAVYAADTHEPEASALAQDLLRYIHQAESSGGTNRNPNALHNLCKSQGKENQYGYGGMALKICFNSHEEATARVMRWLTEHLKKFDGDVAKTLCYYRHGEEMINCQYYQKYLGTL